LSLAFKSELLRKKTHYTSLMKRSPKSCTIMKWKSFDKSCVEKNVKKVKDESVVATGLLWSQKHCSSSIAFEEHVISKVKLRHFDVADSHQKRLKQKTQQKVGTVKYMWPLDMLLWFSSHFSYSISLLPNVKSRFTPAFLLLYLSMHKEKNLGNKPKSINLYFEFTSTRDVKKICTRKYSRIKLATGRKWIL